MNLAAVARTRIPLNTVRLGPRIRQPAPLTGAKLAMKIRILTICLCALCLLGCPDKKQPAHDGHEHDAKTQSVNDGHDHSAGDGHDHSGERDPSKTGHKQGDGHDH